MFRSSLIVAGAALLCSTAAAQNRIDPARMVPVTGQLRNAGTVDITTGQWTAPNAQQKKAVQTVYNNTCTWITTVYYAGFAECEDSYDEGAIPSTSRPGAPAGAADSQTMDGVQIYYCTYNATPVGGLDIELAFWDKLNGNCVGGIAPTPPNWATTATAYIPLAGIGLPGSTTNGNQACWIVTLDVSNSGWVMQSDGEGTYDGINPDDVFIWGKRFNTVTPVTGLPNGFLITGEPASGTYGSCTYTIACGVDPNNPAGTPGATCGTGLDTWDGSWINIDGVALGATSGYPVTCTGAVSPLPNGTGCYFFGGYPTNPFDSYWLVLTAEGGTGQAATFCTATPSSLAGCSSTLVGADSISKSAGAGSYTLSATPAPGGNQAGIFIYTRNGILGSGGVLATFGWRCIATVVRGKPDLPGGTPNNCNGQYDWDLGNFVNITPSILPGDNLHIQAWYRDPGKPAGALFTDGAGPIAVGP